MGRRNLKLGATAAALAVAASSMAIGPVRGETSTSPPDAGAAFNVGWTSEPLYGIRPPTADPATQQHYVAAEDGTQLFVEAWLPEAKDGHVPPEKLPTIVVMSPYSASGNPTGSPTTVQLMVPRGYAYVQLHVRGSGRSFGCIEENGPLEASDGAEVVRWLAEEAPWSNRNIGIYGHSYSGGTALATLGRGPRDKTKYVKAALIGAPSASFYEVQAKVDGVPAVALSHVHPALYFEVSKNGMTAEQAPSRVGCVPAAMVGTAPQGDMTPWYLDREQRRWVENIRPPVFMFHGHTDLNEDGAMVLPSAQDGLFDRLTRSQQRFGMFGVFGHEFPSERFYPRIRPEDWVRPDFDRMRVAWFDHWLRDIDGGVDDWPVAQVQGTDGQWRHQADWPASGGRTGQLTLGPGGTLGAAAPTGQSVYTEGAPETSAGFAPGTSLVFSTGPLPGRLELTGRPVLDLWAVLDQPDAHVAARLEALDAAGQPIRSSLTWGTRSAQHLDPFVDGMFVQTEPKPAPVGIPVQIPVRFHPTSLVVPEGGSLRLTIAGSLTVNPGVRMLGVPDPVLGGPSQPSGSGTVVSVLHDCAVRVSAVRFEIPDAQPQLVNVQELDEDFPVADQPAPAFVDSTGGGVATAGVCGG